MGNGPSGIELLCTGFEKAVVAGTATTLLAGAGYYALRSEVPSVDLPLSVVLAGSVGLGLAAGAFQLYRTAILGTDNDEIEAQEAKNLGYLP